MPTFSSNVPSGRKMKPLVKLLLIVALPMAVLFGARELMQRGLIPTPNAVKALVPERVQLPSMADATPNTNIKPVAFPLATPGQVTGCQIPIEVWAWNAQAGIFLAIGGTQTAKGSLAEKYNANFSIRRQDDTNKMGTDLFDYAKALQGGDTCPANGVAGVIIMGDQAGATFGNLNERLRKLGPEYMIKVYWIVGKSWGEDKVMGLPAWKSNPRLMLGKTLAGSCREGDWNIALKFMGDNALKNNPDDQTYDPDAVNWICTNDYIEAGQKYIENACGDRRVTKDGRPTGETKHVCPDGVVTWTPVDVTVAKQRGGLINIVSTKEYSSMMPAAFFAVKKAVDLNREAFKGLARATFEAGDQIKVFPDALKKATQIEAEVYQYENGAYWEHYYKGAKEKDKTGLTVELGGSYVNNLNDDLIWFGLMPGTNNNFKSSYEKFCKVAKQQYPKLVADCLPAEQISDTSLIRELYSEMSDTNVAEIETPTYEAGKANQQTVSKRDWSINFETGSARFTPEGEATMKEIKDDTATAQALAITVNGYTDDTGSAQTNVYLSGARAAAVKQWLQTKARYNYPDSRFHVEGFGVSTLYPNDSPANRAKNRRVEILLTEAR